MKKIFLSFSVIVAFALFATFSRRNIGIGADRFLAPSTSILANSQPVTQTTQTVASSDPAPKKTAPVPVSSKPALANPTSATAPVSTPTPTSVPVSSGQYKDGSYTGNVVDAYYGNIQVQAVIQNGKLADVVFLQYPSDRRTSVEINTQAMPYLKSEAIAAQSGNVNIVSGATDSSMAFIQSMNSALALARN